MKKTKAFAILLVILISLSGGKAIRAYAALPPGLIGYGRFMNCVSQAKSNWCWAACAENAVRFERSITRTQWDAVYYIKGYETNPYPDVAGTIYNIQTAAVYISNGTEGYIAEENAKSYSFICEKIYDDHPIIAASEGTTETGQPFGHATLIYEWYTGNGVNEISYHDPNPQLSPTCYITCPYSDFCDGTTNGGIYVSSCYHV